MATRIRRFGTVTAVAAAAVVTGLGPAHAMAGGQQVTDPGEAPWMATLAIKGMPLPQGASCGGALIAPTKVVTAAHCLAGVPIATLRDKVEYHVGALTLSRQPGHTAGIADVTIHPDYRLLPSPADPDDPNADSATYDVAVVTLDRAVSGTTPLPVAVDDAAPGTGAALYGHGITSPNSGTSDALNRGGYVLLPDAACAPLTPATVDPASMRCAQGVPAEACEGDSGGPLVADVDGRPELVGVFSFGMETAGEPCGTAGPNFFTSAPVVRTWLLDQTR